MIDRTLPPIPCGNTIYPDHIREALALCLHAGYNDVPIQPRVLTSFQRAYGMHSMENVPFVANGRPGFTIAYWGLPSGRRIVVAIEGTRTRSQLTIWNGGLTTQSGLTGHAGMCWDTALTYANQIRILLQANTTFAGLLASQGTMLTFTGHSLGAAVAEVLGEIYAVSNPGNAVRVIKFASPRVGTPAWVAGRVRNVARASIYCDRDPIDIFPMLAPQALNGAFPNTIGRACYSTDDSAQRWTKNGDDVGSFYEGGFYQAIHYGRWFTRTIDGGNPWYDHTINVYRLMFSNIVAAQDTLEKYRFLYLEFNDQNQWGQEFVRGDGIRAPMLDLNVVQPDPVPVNVTNEVMLIAQERVGMSVAQPASEDWQAGGWDAPEPTENGIIPQVQPNVMQMLAVPGRTFTPNMSGRRRR